MKLRSAMHALWRSFWVAFAVIAILSAIGVSLARAVLPNLSGYHQEIERLVSSYLGQPVQIGQMQLAWHGWGPELRIGKLRMQGVGKVLRFEKARLSFDVLDILQSGRLEPSALSIIGARLAVQRRADGSFSVEGLASRALPGAGSEDVSLEWLFTRRRVELRDSELHWVDQKHGGADLEFDDVNVAVFNDGARHRIKGEVTLPEEVGRQLSFAADLEGDLGTRDGWGGRVYLRGVAIRPVAWLDQYLPPWTRVHGSTDLELWGDWAHGGLQRLSGTARFRDLQLASQNPARPAELKLDEAAGRFAWRRREGEWRLDVDHLRVVHGDTRWPETGFSFRVADGAQGLEVQGGFGWLNLADLAQAARTTPYLDQVLFDALGGMAPQGEVHNLRFRFQLPPGGQPQLEYAGQFSKLALHRWQEVPAVAGLEGEVAGNATSGQLHLAGHAVHLTFAKLFRNELQAETVAGDIAWRYHEGGLRIVADDLQIDNPDLHTRTRLRLDVPVQPGQTAYLDMQTAFRDGDLSQVRKYLPVTVLPPDTVDWVDRALVSGRVTDGTMLFHGPLADFPFDGNEGRFEVVANIQDGVLDYAEHWPRIEALHAQLRFANRTMSISADEGRIFGADLHHVQVQIADLDKARLMIDGVAEGDLSSMLRFLRESPLGERGAAYSAGLEGHGASRLELHLELPLPKIEPRSRISLSLHDASLHSSRWNGTLSGLNGVLHYDDREGFSADGISGRLFGRPVKIDMRPVGGRQPETDIQVSGRFGVHDLPRTTPLAGYLKGESLWQARVRVPATATRKLRPQLHLESDLVGTTVDLPAPLGKQAATRRPFTLDTRLGTAREGLELAYGKQATARIVMHEQHGRLRFERGGIAFGGAPLTVPPTAGLFIGGKLAHLALEQWQQALGLGDKAEPPSMLGGVDLQIGLLDAMGRSLHAVHLRLGRDKEAWVVHLQAKEMAGSALVPKRPGPGAPLVISMQRMEIEPLSPERAGEVPDPRRLPPVWLSCKDMKYAGVDLGRVDMRTRPVAQGLRLDSLTTDSPLQRFELEGLWSQHAGKQQSDFRITLHSSDLGKLMAAWGYAGNMREGRLVARIDARWLGAPSQFALDKLQGSLNLKIFDGRILDIEPGVGRVFGLLSLQTLPRWLTLDFGDLFKKGFSYDNIKGDFRFRDGNAYTDNLRMDGSAARVEIKGRIGLKAKDYDQQVTVLPHVTSSLPVVGAIAGGPVAGVALWMADKLFGRKVERLTAHRYTVSGSWEKPVIKRVDAQAGADAATPAQPPAAAGSAR